MAGRALTRHLYPLTPWEAQLDLPNTLQFGSLPQIVLKPNSAKTRLRSYVHTYLKEEIQLEALTRKIDSFTRFLDVAGQMNGEPVNFSAIGKDCGISPPTVQEYFSILDDTLVVHRLPGWERSARKQLLHAPKYYFFDCGVLNAIRGELNSELKPSSFRYGRLFETWIIQLLFRLNDYHEADFALHYWRTNTGTEVDVILSRPGGSPLFAIENPETKLMCFCQTPRPYTLSGIDVLPWQLGLERLFEIESKTGS